MAVENVFFATTMFDFDVGELLFVNVPVKHVSQKY